MYKRQGLGYIGVDMVLDQDKGPLILELNARPGLNIQIANDCGLTHRAHAVEARLEELKAKGIQETPEERVRFSQELFGHGFSKEIGLVRRARHWCARQVHPACLLYTSRCV